MAFSRTLLVAGCGAIGGVHAAFLSRVARVIAYDANTAHVAAIQRDGLAITGVTELNARLDACSQPAQLAGHRFDAVIVAVKSTHTATLLAELAPCLTGAPVFLTQQNGQGNVELLLEAGPWPVLHGMTLEAAEYLSPGRIRHTVHGPVSTIGPARGELGALRWLGELMDAAGLPTRVVADPRGAIWTKFLFNAAFNPVSALLRGIPEAKYASEDVYALARSMIDEGRAVAAALDIELAGDPLHILEAVRSGALPIPRHPGSMAIDIERGTPTEIEALTGYLVRKADALGIPVPVHRAVYRLLKGLELGVRRAASSPPAR